MAQMTMPTRDEVHARRAWPLIFVAIGGVCFGQLTSVSSHVIGVKSEVRSLERKIDAISAKLAQMQEGS